MEILLTETAADREGRLSILILDDVPANLGGLLDFLEAANHEVLVAESGERPLPPHAHAHPDPEDRVPTESEWDCITRAVRGANTSSTREQATAARESRERSGPLTMA